MSVTAIAGEVHQLIRFPRVLIVDDDEHARRMWEKELSKECHMEFAASGEEGLRVFRCFMPELVILDRNMPGMSGDEVLREIRKSDPIGMTRVVMHSVRDLPDEQIARMGEGANFYIPKTTTMPVAAATIRSLLATQQSTFVASVVETARRGLSSSHFADQLVAKGAMQYASLLNASSPIPVERLNLSIIVSDVRDMLREQAERLHVGVYYNQGGPAEILGNRDLLMSAIYFMADYFLSPAIVDKNDLNIEIHSSSNTHTISISSLASSIITDKLFRWCADDQKVIDLGLPLSWEIFNRHNGELIARSDTNSTTFTASLPIFSHSVKKG